MSDHWSVVVAIPARWGSERFQGKLMEDLNGQPLLKHTWDRVKQAKGVDAVFVIVDDQRLFDAVTSWGGNAVMSTQECCCGTERIACSSNELDADFIINVQGDECLIDPKSIEALIEVRKNHPEADVITPVYKIDTQEQLLGKNVVKVVLRNNGQAIYFSRSPIPCIRDSEVDLWLAKQDFWGHVGMYGYKREVLANYSSMECTYLEDCERLEQLRFIEAGLTIQTFPIKNHRGAVDSAQDLKSAKNYLESK